MSFRATVAAVLLLATTSNDAIAASAPASRAKLLTVDIQLSKDGRAVYTTQSEITATNDAAAMKIGQMAIPYDAALSSLEVLSAYTLKKDGTRIPVDPTAIYDQLAPGMQQMPMFTEFHSKTIVFPQFAAGDTAVYTVKLTAKEAALPGQYWYGDLYPRQTAFDEVRETVTAPADMALKIESHDVEFSRRRDGDRMVYSWHYSAPTPEPPELFAVTSLAKTPRFFLSTFADYRALGDAYAAEAAPKMAVTPPIQALADRLTNGIGDKREQVKALYDWVSGHIRYVAVELGRGSLVPHAAADVLTNGYGDCKDHVTLLGALLKAKGIESQGVLIDSGVNYELTEAPTFTGLNHIITYIPSLDLYLDSTAVVAPFGILPFDEYGKPVVFAAPGASHQGTMPVLPPGLADLYTATTETLSKDGTLTGTTQTTGRGPYGIALRQIGLGVQTLGPENAATRLLASRGYGGDASGSVNAPSPTELAPSYTIGGSFTARHWNEQAQGSRRFNMPGGMRVAPVSGDGLLGALGETGLKPDAKTPCYSGHASEDLSLTAPDGMHFDHTPGPTHVTTPYLTFDATWTLSGQTLKVHRDFTSRISQPLCDADVRAANKEALKAISDSYDEQLKLVKETESGANAGPAAGANAAVQAQSGAQTLSSQERDELLAMVNTAQAAAEAGDMSTVKRLISVVLAHPSLPDTAAASAHQILAVAALESANYDAALNEVEAAISKSPDTAGPVTLRGTIHLHQRKRELALADFARAIELAPSDSFARYQHGNAELLLGNYAAAVSDYASVMKDDDLPVYRLLTAVAEEKLGHHDRALENVAAAVKDGSKDAMERFEAAIKDIAPPPRAPASEPAWNIRAGAKIQRPTPANVHEGTSFPELSRLMMIDGAATVAFTIGADGKVSDPSLVKSTGFDDLDAAAVEAVKAWLYHPALSDGKPISVRYRAQVWYRFHE